MRLLAFSISSILTSMINYYTLKVNTALNPRSTCIWHLQNHKEKDSNNNFLQPGLPFIRILEEIRKFEEMHLNYPNKHRVDWVSTSVCLYSSLIQQWYRGPPLGFLHHVGLVSERDVDSGRSQLARLSVHLHGDWLIGGEGHLTTLIKPLTMTSDL